MNILLEFYDSFFSRTRQRNIGIYREILLIRSYYQSQISHFISFQNYSLSNRIYLNASSPCPDELKLIISKLALLFQHKVTYMKKM